MKHLSRILLVMALFTTPLVQAQQTKVIKTDKLSYHVYTAKPANFGVTSVLLEGKKELVLIDAQFSKDEAQNVAEMIKKTGKELKTVFVSHSDPDFYFGLDVINEHFPNATILSTAQTAYLIDATKEGKLAVWSPQLKENAPSKIIIPEAITTQSFAIEGIEIEIKQSKEDPAHIYLWIPSTKTVLGGVSLFDDMHLWVADSPEKSDRDNWISKLNEMAALQPAMTIPAHFDLSKNPTLSPRAIEYTKNYLTAFETALAEEKTTDAFIARMKATYPNAAEEGHLDLSAKALRGDIPWQVTKLFPAVGRKAKVDFGNFSFELNFKDNKNLSFVGKGGDMEGVTDEVVYTATEIRPNVYMVYWTEPKTKSNVVHVEDFENGIVYTNISMSDGTFLNLKGTLTLLD